MELKTPTPTAAGTPFGGGLYVGRFALGEQMFALIAAPVDFGELGATAWGGTKTVAGALSVDDGLANTQAMADAGGALGNWAQALRIEGFDDWYLPSRLEALLMFSKLLESGGFKRDWYWTSTQYVGDDACAWSQSFTTGSQYDGRKRDQLRARAVRRLIIQ